MMRPAYVESDTFAFSISYKKWSYDEKVRSIVFPAKILRPDIGSDEVHIFRPRGT